MPMEDVFLFKGKLLVLSTQVSFGILSQINNFFERLYFSKELNIKNLKKSGIIKSLMEEEIPSRIKELQPKCWLELDSPDLLKSLLQK